MPKDTIILCGDTHPSSLLVSNWNLDRKSHFRPRRLHIKLIEYGETAMLARYHIASFVVLSIFIHGKKSSSRTKYLVQM